MNLFNRIKHQTPESVELEFNLAGIGSRAWALIIDYHILGLSLTLLFLAFSYSYYQLSEFFIQRFGNANKLGLWLFAIGFLITFFIYTGYFVFFETLWQGQTPGKRIAKIRVIRDDGRPVGLQHAILRSLLRPVDDLMFIGALLIMFTNKEKRLGDFVSGTFVIQQESNTIKKQNLILSSLAENLADKLLQISDFSQMLPDDFAVIREYLQRRVAMTPKAKTRLSQGLSQQIKAILNLQVLPDNVTPEVFLEAVYLAYQKANRY
jgi:uncharacterized RDD family membrane protein YckC